VNLFKNILLLWAQHRAFRAVYAELSRHSDRELQDMGIARGDITRLAYAEAERRTATRNTTSGSKASAPAWPNPALAPGR
jgi:uncharacterized protein YjiS (DUF1127 family)